MSTFNKSYFFYLYSNCKSRAKNYCLAMSNSFMIVHQHILPGVQGDEITYLFTFMKSTTNLETAFEESYFRYLIISSISPLLAEILRRKTGIKKGAYI